MTTDLHSPDERVLLQAWFSGSGISCEIDQILTERGFDRRCNFYTRRDAAVGAIAVSDIQKRLPNCGIGRSDGTYTMTRTIRPTSKRQVSRLPRHLFTMNWADSAPACGLPPLLATRVRSLRAGLLGRQPRCLRLLRLRARLVRPGPGLAGAVEHLGSDALGVRPGRRSGLRDRGARPAGSGMARARGHRRAGGLRVRRRGGGRARVAECAWVADNAGPAQRTPEDLAPHRTVAMLARGLPTRCRSVDRRVPARAGPRLYTATVPTLDAHRGGRIAPPPRVARHGDNLRRMPRCASSRSPYWHVSQKSCRD